MPEQAPPAALRPGLASLEVEDIEGFESLSLSAPSDIWTSAEIALPEGGVDLDEIEAKLLRAACNCRWSETAPTW